MVAGELGALVGDDDLALSLAEVAAENGGAEQSLVTHLPLSGKAATEQVCAKIAKNYKTVA